MWGTVRPTSLAISLKVGTGAKALRSFLITGGRLAGGVTGTGTVLGPWDCAIRLRIKKQQQRRQDLEDPDMCRLRDHNKRPAGMIAQRDVWEWEGFATIRM